MVSCRASFDADQAWRQSFEKSNNVISSKLSTNDDCSGSVGAMNLKNLLGDIQTDCGNLFHGRFSLM